MTLCAIVEFNIYLCVQCNKKLARFLHMLHRSAQNLLCSAQKVGTLFAGLKFFLINQGLSQPGQGRFPDPLTGPYLGHSHT